MRSIIEKNCEKILFGLITLFILIFSEIVLHKYYSLGYNGFDLAIINQAFYLSSAGHLFASSISFPSYLGDHFTPLLIILLPIYYLFKNPQCLLIIQVFFIGFTAIPIFLIAREKLGKTRALFISLFWMINPFVGNLLLFEFHFLPLALFFLFFGFYFYQKGQFKWWLIFSLLALLANEDVSLFILGYTLLGILDIKKLKTLGQKIKWLAMPLFISLAYLALSLLIIRHFNLNHDYKFIRYYSWMGSGFLRMIAFAVTHPLAIIGHLFQAKNLELILGLSLPFLFIPFIKPKYLALALMPFLQYGLTQGGAPANVLITHYSTLFLPGLVIAYIYSLSHLINSGGLLIKKSGIPANLFIFILVFSLFFSYYFLGPNFFSSGPRVFHLADKNIYQKISAIPNKDRVVADYESLTILSSRNNLYPLEYAFTGKGQYLLDDYKIPGGIDYLILDKNDIISFQLTMDPKNYGAGEASLMKLIKINNLKPTAEIGNKIFFAKSADSAYGFIDVENNPGKINAVAGQDISLKKITLEAEKSSDGLDYRQYNLTVTYAPINPQTDNYLMGAKITGNNHEIFNDYFPLDLGLYSAVQWAAGKDYSIKYFLSLPKNTAPPLDLKCIIATAAGGIQLDQARSVVPTLDSIKIIDQKEISINLY